MINRDPADLNPKFASHLNSFIANWNAFNPLHTIGLFEGFRTFERQAELYAQGRTTPGAVVTNAPMGFSWHNYGLAADLVFDADPVKPGLQWTWDGKQPWMAMGLSAQAAGFDWAGAWKHFKEYPHVQMTFGLQLTEARELYMRGGLAAVWEAI